MSLHQSHFGVLILYLTDCVTVASKNLQVHQTFSTQPRWLPRSAINVVYASQPLCSLPSTQLIPPDSPLPVTCFQPSASSACLLLASATNTFTRWKVLLESNVCLLLYF